MLQGCSCVLVAAYFRAVYKAHIQEQSRRYKLQSKAKTLKACRKREAWLVCCASPQCISDCSWQDGVEDLFEKPVRGCDEEELHLRFFSLPDASVRFRWRRRFFMSANHLISSQSMSANYLISSQSLTAHDCFNLKLFGMNCASVFHAPYAQKLFQGYRDTWAFFLNNSF